jgi:hypothetical protein
MLHVSNCTICKRIGTVTGTRFCFEDVTYCTISVRSRVVKATFGTITYCAVLGLSESGTLSYCTELERIGTVTTNSNICDLLTVESESSSDLLIAVGNIELIHCLSPYTD